MSSLMACYRTRTKPVHCHTILYIYIASLDVNREYHISGPPNLPNSLPSPTYALVSKSYMPRCSFRPLYHVGLDGPATLSSSLIRGVVLEERTEKKRKVDRGRQGTHKCSVKSSTGAPGAGSISPSGESFGKMRILFLPRK